MSAAPLVVVAGFRDDLLDALGRHGIHLELGDESPFTEWLPGVGLPELDLLGELAGWSGAGLVAAAAVPTNGLQAAGSQEMVVTVRQAPAGWVQALSKVDDQALGGLRDRWWQQLRGNDAVIPGELADAVRGVVVQCRAAPLNGWQVLVAEP